MVEQIRSPFEEIYGSDRRLVGVVNETYRTVGCQARAAWLIGRFGGDFCFSSL